MTSPKTPDHHVSREWLDLTDGETSRGGSRSATPRWTGRTAPVQAVPPCVRGRLLERRGGPTIAEVSTVRSAQTAPRRSMSPPRAGQLRVLLDVARLLGQVRQRPEQPIPLIVAGQRRAGRAHRRHAPPPAIPQCILRACRRSWSPFPSSSSATSTTRRRAAAPAAAASWPPPPDVNSSSRTPQNWMRHSNGPGRPCERAGPSSRLIWSAPSAVGDLSDRHLRRHQMGARGR